MAIQTILCEYIYAGFLVVKAALEAVLLYAKKIITTIDSFVMAVENMIKNGCLEVVDAALARLSNIVQIFSRLYDAKDWSAKHCLINFAIHCSNVHTF